MEIRDMSIEEFEEWRELSALQRELESRPIKKLCLLNVGPLLFEIKTRLKYFT